MTHAEATYRVAAALIRSDGPLTLRELTSLAEITDVFAREAADHLVEAGESLLIESPGQEPRYAWRERPQGDTSRERLPGIESLLTRRFNDLILNQYEPPEPATHLAVFQCCVGRPFYRTGSHAFMRRAVEVAAGCDPYLDWRKCPVHVVVLASYIGPVPYELQTIYPANIGASGVKQMSPQAYERHRPLLVERFSQYLRRHGSHYRYIATFTDGRYADIMREVACRADRSIVILPATGGPEVVKCGASVPRTYWQRYWIQLALQLGRWLGTPVESRLRSMEVEYQ